MTVQTPPTNPTPHKLNVLNILAVTYPIWPNFNGRFLEPFEQIFTPKKIHKKNCGQKFRHKKIPPKKRFSKKKLRQKEFCQKQNF